ncbi:MAG: bisanhydrobacterioruberin hydratase [Halobacteriales archaeon]|nr:bisanhydrobacterioruberin hydratase [Halobacteriales archaeon]
MAEGSEQASARGWSTLNRRAIEARFEGVVRANRTTIAVVFPLVGATLMAAGLEGIIPRWIAMHPYLLLFATLVMRTPLFAGLLPLIDRRGLAGLVALTAFTYGIEFLGVTTGFPYGEFVYQTDLGPMLFGEIPAALPIFFFPLLLNSYLLILLLLPRAGRLQTIPLAAAVVITMDFVLDPAAVALGFWEYAAAGVYYGVPASNFLGWLGSGTVAAIIVGVSFDPDRLRDRLRSCEFMLDDFVSFVVLWGLLNLYFGHAIPVAIAGGLTTLLYTVGRFDFPIFGG